MMDDYVLLMCEEKGEITVKINLVETVKKGSNNVNRCSCITYRCPLLLSFKEKCGIHIWTPNKRKELIVFPFSKKSTEVIPWKSQSIVAITFPANKSVFAFFFSQHSLLTMSAISRSFTQRSSSTWYCRTAVLNLPPPFRAWKNFRWSVNKLQI